MQSKNIQYHWTKHDLRQPISKTWHDQAMTYSSLKW